MREHGLGVALGGWLFIHGVTELFAITLAGAAGFRIGWALAFPGEQSRIDALTRRRAGIAATVMVGVVVMLVVAGLLEGFGAPADRQHADPLRHRAADRR